MSRNNDLINRISRDAAKAVQHQHLNQLELEASLDGEKHLALSQTRDAVVESNKTLARQVEAIEKIAKAAETQSDLAVKKAKKADIKGIVAVVISLVALIWSIVSHFI